MAVLIASGLRKEFSGDPLFDGVAFRLRRGDRLALAGPNGAGKTTLLRAIVGETSLTSGELAFAKDTRLALHDQRPPRGQGLTLREYSLSGAGDLVAIEEKLTRLEQAMAGGDHAPATLRRYSETQARLEHAGGWAWRDRAASILRGLGFRGADLDRPLDSFSGGELTRASLARAMSADPDLLLLDEPTNHLDVESLEWLERELTSLDAAVILVAHDRWFLEAVTTAVLELGGPKPFFFDGPWHAWRREKAARASAAASQLGRVSDDIERLERFVARFRYKKSKAKQAQAKLSQIGRLEQERRAAAQELEAMTRRRRTLGFEFLKPARSGRMVLEADDLVVSAGDKLLLDGASLVLERGEHVALVGPNGSGKTTLLEILLGQREPDEGRVKLGHGVLPAYFSQHEAELPDRGSILDVTASETGLPRPQAQNLLGRFLFSGWETHEKSVTVLSGGERRRLALALVVASGANLLVLDEPTNHLDLESREALEAALEAFPGTVLLVTHDRAVLDAVPDRIVAVEDLTLRSYEGGWADLVRERESTPTLPTASPTPKRAPKPVAQRRPKPTELDTVEKRIAELEPHVAELESRLAENWTDIDLLGSYTAGREELDGLLARWEVLFATAQAGARMNETFEDDSLEEPRMPTDGRFRSYDEAVAAHEWEVPERYNIAEDVCDKHPPDKLAMLWEDYRGNERQVHWGELQDASSRLASVLGRHGVEVGDRVAMLLTPRPETAAAFLGAFKAGTVLLSLSVLYGDEGIRHRVTDSQAKVLVTNAENVTRVRGLGLPVEHVLVLDEHLLAEGDPSFERIDTHANDPAQLYYTSGTTGLAKGILHAHRYLLAHNEFELCHDVRDGERFHGTGEWAWVAGIAPLLGPWRYGAVQVVYEREGGFDARKQLEFLSKHEVTNVFSTPTAIRSMMSIADAGTRYPQRFRIVCAAGEPLNPEAIRWFREQYGVTILDYYGLSESYPLCANFPFMDVREGSMGRPTPGWDVTILDEDERPVPPGERGEICLRARSNPHYPLGYWNNEEAARETFGGAWFHTKDAARMDTDGYVWYEGRADDVIIAAGYRIGPFEVESACLEHPAVAEAAAVASPDERRGSVVKAFIVLAEGHQASDDLAEDIQAHVRNRLSAYHYPRLVEFVPSLPKTLTGKIRRIELREAEARRARVGEDAWGSWKRKPL